MNAAVSAQKTLQGFERETTELLGGTEESSVEGSLISPPGKSVTFSTKRNQKKIELVARPVAEAF